MIFSQFDKKMILQFNLTYLFLIKQMLKNWTSLYYLQFPHQSNISDNFLWKLG